MRVYYYEYEASITASLNLNQQQGQDLIGSAAQVASGEPGSAMLIGAWLCYAQAPGIPGPECGQALAELESLALLC